MKNKAHLQNGNSATFNLYRQYPQHKGAVIGGGPTTGFELFSQNVHAVAGGPLGNAYAVAYLLITIALCQMAQHIQVLFVKRLVFQVAEIRFFWQGNDGFAGFVGFSHEVWFFAHEK